MTVNAGGASCTKDNETDRQSDNLRSRCLIASANASLRVLDAATALLQGRLLQAQLLLLQALRLVCIWWQAKRRRAESGVVYGSLPER